MENITDLWCLFPHAVRLFWWEKLKFSAVLRIGWRTHSFLVFETKFELFCFSKLVNVIELNPDPFAGNEITKIEGLEGLQDLRELVLDRNKIKGLTEYSFMNQWNLVELHMEENRMRDLSHFQFLENLQRLYLGSNRLQVQIIWILFSINMLFLICQKINK